MSDAFRHEILDQLHSLQSDISQPHEFNFYLYFPNEIAAKEAADKVQESEFAAKIMHSSDRDNWLCIASVRIVPKTAPLSEIGDFFEQIAAALEGDFDGWESSVVTIKK